MHASLLRRLQASSCLALALLCAQLSTPASARDGQGIDAPLTRDERARFLEHAEIVRVRSAGRGITHTLRATLSDGTTTHDASIQTVDESQTVFQSNRGTEIGFRDTWRYNVAAYHLSLLLGLDMVPVTVERRYLGKDASFTWWIDGVLMDEGERLKKKLLSPDLPGWNRQLWTLRIFDQLIENTDRNLGNMLIDQTWKVWMIDHTRAFRRNPALRNIRNLEQCDRRLLDALKALEAPTLEKSLARWLRSDERRPILARRDLIVGFFERAPERVY